MKPYFAIYAMMLGLRHYRCECRVVPARAEPHVGADSPHYMEPGTRGCVRVLAVLEGAVWQDPRDLRPETLRELQAECERQAGVHASSVAIPEDQLALDVEAMR